VSNVKIAHLAIHNTGTVSGDDGIYSPHTFGTSSNHVYYDLEVYGVEDGFDLYDIDNTVISSNYVHNVTGRGVEYYTSENVIVSDNNIQETGGAGIVADVNSYTTVIDGNYIYNAGAQGIYLWGAINSTVSNNVVDVSSSTGIYVYQSSYSTVTGNTVKNAGGNGIADSQSDYVVISSNNIENATSSGVSLGVNSGYFSILGNVIYSSGADGISTVSALSGGHTVIGNVLDSNAEWGLDVEGGTYDGYDSVYANNTFRGNTLGSIDVTTEDRNNIYGPNFVQGDTDLMFLGYYPPTGQTFSNDLLKLRLDGEDADGFTGNGLHIIVDQSQNTGNLVLAEDDAGTDVFWLNESGGAYFAGNVGVGTTNPGGAFDISSTSAQLRLSNGTASTSFTTNTSGDLTIAPSGQDVSINYSLSVGSGVRDRRSKFGRSVREIVLEGDEWWKQSNCDVNA